MTRTSAGDHPSVHRVWVSVDDPNFGKPIQATIDEASGTWSASLGALPLGGHAIYARASMDTTKSAVARSTFIVGPKAHVEWQIVKPGTAARPGAWKTANGLGSWNFTFKTSTYGHGARTLIVRLVQGNAVLARQSVSIRLR